MHYFGGLFGVPPNGPIPGPIPDPEMGPDPDPLFGGPDVSKGLTTCLGTSGYGVRKGSILGPRNRPKKGPVLDPPKSQQRI